MIGPLKFSPELTRNTHLSGSNALFLDELYARYRDDPNSVDDQWRQYFFSLDQAAPVGHDATGVSSADAAAFETQGSVLRIINAYRVRGHQQADIDPLDLFDQEPIPDLDPAFHGLTEADMEHEFNTGSLAAPDRMPLRDILALVQKVYCGTVGSEYMHITNTEEKRWIQARLEPGRGKPQFEVDARLEILERLTAAEGIEKYLHTKYVGQKRFSLEGGESLIPLLDELIQRGGSNGIREMVIGMAHRGRLNVLVNVLGKAPGELFSEFEGKHDIQNLRGSGDVKYHQGFSSDVRTPGDPVHLALAFNPSHLEIVGPVVEGSVKARQIRREDRFGDQVLPVIVHGDAAFAGQGVVMETFNMSKARGYGTGGTIHVIVNNQIGFTTSNPSDARSTFYCTEVAKMVQAPIFHVNGDDPEAVVFITQLALDFRMQFHRDVVIDLVCYRRHGHNEADEPTVTQPEMYKRIRELPTTRQLYANHLIEDGALSEEQAVKMAENYRESLEHQEVVVEDFLTDSDNDYAVDWTPYQNTEWTHPTVTGVKIDKLRDLAERLQRLPDGFELQPRVAKIMADRRKMMAGELNLDWGMAETLAYASVLEDGFPIRISGQDSARGTFFHRHAALHNQNNREVYVPLRNLSQGQPRFLVINSLLSEEAVLAFEYGYATAEPHTLVIWEAQFGDFANGAQVVIDQFISSGDAKWNRLCGLTMFLPHGYEGQGPEHSSARLERYLQLCAEFNMQVCVPTSPAQMFHMLRRQAIRPYRRPLVVMTPKSLLRHRLSTSTLEELESGEFQVVMEEIDAHDDQAIERLVLCSGKVYFDLLEERRKRELTHIAIVRIEQLYPFPRDHVIAQLGRYPNAHEVFWCQEEPRNQGAWYQIQHHLRACVRHDQALIYAGRPASPSPAAGYYSVHLEQQKQVIGDAFSSFEDRDQESIGEKRHVS
ncbi:MAG: 2-oxoglutarate dehydrogenase E1 component [Gammaproteobacteria bacterium]|nr:2-oxoglutarate dehydrogenase E1 component [Gammaproteobacteria bacterium]